MDNVMLFTSDSVWTMIHGIILGGGALLGLSAALFALATIPGTGVVTDASVQKQARYLGWLMIAVAAVLWATVIVGTYVNFPPYRAAPPEGTLSLAQYPSALLKSSPATNWLHSFGMEIKEHVPWMAAMLATAIAFVTMRYRSRFLTDSALRRTTTTLVTICFILVAAVSLLGVMINKVAPLD